MECERCGEDTQVERYDVGGFTGHLRPECVETWKRIQEHG